MSNTGQETHLGKRLPTIYGALILIIVFCIPESQSFAACQYEKCDEDTHANSTLSLNQFSNSTLSLNQFSNSTLSLNQFSNSTVEGTGSLLFNQFSNSTHVGKNNHVMTSENLDIADAITANGTNQTFVPNPTKSFQLISETSSTGNKKQNDDDSLHLRGDEYVNENSSTTNLNNLTISAWIKPDYSLGSPIFTIISEEDAFMLAVNNSIPPQKTAVFSIFDGIKWITTQSIRQIPEQWTFLAATFDGTSIRLYVNGNPESVSAVTGVPTLVDGKLTTGLVQNITSDANVTIGAYYEKTRMYTMDHFSGEISGVNIYNASLTQKQIDQVYHITKHEYNVTHSN